MKKGILFSIFGSLVLLMSVGCTSKHLLNFNDQYYYLSNEMGPSIDSIDRAIKQAGAKRGWRMMTKKPGHISAVIVVRQHKAEVDILFDRQKFSIKYRDSMNLNYNASRNTIHRSYNTWVTNLRNDIQNTVALTPEDSGNQPKSAGQ